MKISPIRVLLLSVMVSLFAFSGQAFAAAGDAVRTAEPFTGKVLVEGLDGPWEMLWGPDNMLWVTERLGKKIVRVDPASGAVREAARIDRANAAGGHEGILGLALAPDFLKKGGKNYVYVVYTYKSSPSQSKSDFKRIARFRFDAKSEKLVDEKVILDKIPAGDDHNAGRIVFGPDGKLYLSLGELGHNQGANMLLPNEAQRLPSAAEVRKSDWSSYVGKVLRIEPDGSIPRDNPVLDGVRSHIFTYGHRNPQGLVFVGENLFSCEHGPSTDDEINLLVSGGNYGWPIVAGFRDNQAYTYADWSKADKSAVDKYDPNQPNIIPEGVPVIRELDWNAPNFKEPLKTFYTVPNGYNFKDSRFEKLPYLFWPTVAPSSITYYPADGAIEAWRNSLIITTLKTGELYRMKLNADGKTLQGDAIPYFHTANRYRAAVVSPDTKSIFVITDKGGNVLDRNYMPTSQVENSGAIIVFTYAGEGK